MLNTNVSRYHYDKAQGTLYKMMERKPRMDNTTMQKNNPLILKGGGHANFDAEFFVPMDSLGDA